MEVRKSNFIKSIMVVLAEILLKLVPIIIGKFEALNNENITKELETFHRNLPHNINVY